VPGPVQARFADGGMTVAGIVAKRYDAFASTEPAAL
jgi:hypothetical protein